MDEIKEIVNKHLSKIVMEYINFDNRFYKKELLSKTRDIKFYTSYHYYVNDA